MTETQPRVLSLGDSAVVVEFGFQIRDELNERAISLANQLYAEPFSGFVEAVPAYASTAVFFDLTLVRQNIDVPQTAFSIVRSHISTALAAVASFHESVNVIEIPARFDDLSGPDLSLICNSSGLARNDVIGIFTSRTYKVFMIGFLPGFPYMGEVDQRIQTPRKRNPRLSVPKGSVGIAGSQTGIYPLDSPGGWQIIGQTDVELFRPQDPLPSLLKAGDHAKFVAI